MLLPNFTSFLSLFTLKCIKINCKLLFSEAFISVCWDPTSRWISYLTQINFYKNVLQVWVFLGRHIQLATNQVLQALEIFIVFKVNSHISLYYIIYWVKSVTILLIHKVWGIYHFTRTTFSIFFFTDCKLLSVKPRWIWTYNFS